MPQIGPLEIAVVLLVALLVFGPNRLPELARQAGEAMRELRRIQNNLRDDLHEMLADESTGAAPAPTLPPKEGPAAGIEVAAEVPAPPDDPVPPDGPLPPAPTRHDAD